MQIKIFQGKCQKSNKRCGIYTADHWALPFCEEESLSCFVWTPFLDPLSFPLGLWSGQFSQGCISQAVCKRDFYHTFWIAKPLPWEGNLAPSLWEKLRMLKLALPQFFTHVAPLFILSASPNVTVFLLVSEKNDYKIFLYSIIVKLLYLQVHNIIVHQFFARWAPTSFLGDVLGIS